MKFIVVSFPMAIVGFAHATTGTSSSANHPSLLRVSNPTSLQQKIQLQVDRMEEDTRRALFELMMVQSYDLSLSFSMSMSLSLSMSMSAYAFDGALTAGNSSSIAVSDIDETKTTIEGSNTGTDVGTDGVDGNDENHLNNGDEVNLKIKDAASDHETGNINHDASFGAGPGAIIMTVLITVTLAVGALIMFHRRLSSRHTAAYPEMAGNDGGFGVSPA